VVDCCYRKIGCEYKGQRSIIKEHIADPSHMILMMNKIIGLEQEVNFLQNRVNYLSKFVEPELYFNCRLNNNLAYYHESPSPSGQLGRGSRGD